MITWRDRLRASIEKKFDGNATEFARASGVSKDSIHKYLSTDIASPRGNTLDKMANALDVDVIWLREGIKADKPAKMPQDTIRAIILKILNEYPADNNEMIAAQITKAIDLIYEKGNFDPAFVSAYLTDRDLT